MAPVTANDHISGLTYDPSGNTLTDGQNTYTWDAESQMKTAAGVSYNYDGDGRRVSKSNGKLYWYGSGDEVLAETDASGNTVNEYVFFGGERIALIATTGGTGTYYYIRDHLGTSRMMTTSAGAICYDADFYPFGGERSYTDTCPQNYKFTGKERDSESGLDNFKARFDSPNTGRFMSVDTLSMSDSAASVVADPQNWNAYAYVRNNPLNLIDPTGMLYCTANYSSCISDAQHNKMKASKDVNWIFYTVHIDDELLRAAGLTPAQFMNIAQRIYAEWAQGKNGLDKNKSQPTPALAGVGVAAAAGAELGPADLLLIGGVAVAAVLLAENTKHNKAIMDGLATQIQLHLDLLANNPQSPDPRGGWKKEVRDALERMQRVGKRLGDKAMQNYKDIMGRAAKALEEEAP